MIPVVDSIAIFFFLWEMQRTWNDGAPRTSTYLISTIVSLRFTLIIIALLHNGIIRRVADSVHLGKIKNFRWGIGLGHLKCGVFLGENN